MAQNSTYVECVIDSKLLCEAANCQLNELASVEYLNLHLKDATDGHGTFVMRKIRKIEGLDILRNISVLSLSFNIISKIEGLHNLSLLRELNLAENAIQKFENLNTLQNLEKLNLSGNLISRIPASVSKLTRLTHLRLSRNRLNELEDLLYLRSLVNLVELTIDENPFIEVVQDLVADTQWTGYELFAINYTYSALLNLDLKSVSAEDRRFAADWVSSRDVQPLQRHRPVTLDSAVGTTIISRPSNISYSSDSDSDELPGVTNSSSSNAISRSVGFVKSNVDNVNEVPRPSSSSLSYQNPSRISQSQLGGLGGNSTIIHADAITPVRNSVSESPVSSAAAYQISQSASKAYKDAQRRIEVLVSKVTQSESEKSKLLIELAELKTRISVTDNDTAATQNLLQELNETKEHLIQSQDREATLQRQMQSLSAELTASVSDCEKTVLQLEGVRRDMQLVSGERDQLLSEVLQLREGKLAQDTSNTYNTIRKMNAVDEWQASESRKELMSQRLSVDELRLQIDRQQRDSETLMDKLRAADALTTECGNELDRVKDRLTQSENANKINKSRILELDEQIRELREVNRRLTGNLEKTTEECAEYRDKYERTKADMRTYLAATRKQNTIGIPIHSHKERRNRLSSPKHNLFSKAADHYLDFASSDSEEGGHNVEPRDDATLRVRQPFSSPLSRNMPGRFSLSSLEQTAAQVMAQMLTEELQRTGSKHNGAAFSADLKEACSIVALRLLHTSVGVVRDEQSADIDAMSSEQHGDIAKTPTVDSRPNSTKKLNKMQQLNTVPLTPFHLLGDRKYLSRLVAVTQAGIAAIEDSNMLKAEAEQLKKLIIERERVVDEIQREIVEKNSTLISLKTHCEDAKTKANETLDELDLLAKRLQAGRDDITSVESEYALARRELEMSGARLRESRAMTILEEKNLVSVRAKLLETKDQQAVAEQQLQTNRDLLMKDEEKMRQTAAYADQRLRQLQADLLRFENDFKSKQRVKDEFEKQQRALSDEAALRHRDLETQLNALSRQYEEACNRLHGVKDDIRISQLERDGLLSKRRQAESEIAHLQEQLSSLSSRFGNEDGEAKRKLDSFDKKVLEYEKKIRALKGAVATFEGEQAVLRNSVDELRRQQSDLERSNDTRRRTVDEELTILQHQAQLAVREVNQKKAETDHLRAELETLSGEKHIIERQRDAARRSLQEVEMLLDSRKSETKVCEHDRERLQQECAKLRKVEDELKHKLQMLQSELNSDSRLLEESRRKLNQFHEDQAALQESTSKLQQSHSLKAKELDDLRIRLENVAAQCEREKRDLLDTRTKKSLLESDLHRLEEEIKCAVERNKDECLRQVEMEASLRKTNDELHRLTREVVAKEKMLGDARRLEDDLKYREQELKLNQERIRVETENHKAAIQNERTLVEKLENEHRQLASEIRQATDVNKRLQLEVDRQKIGVETARAQQAHLEHVKDDLSCEIAMLRETCRQEVARTENLERVYSNVESRLQKLREDMQRAETDYELTRNRKEEETHRVEEQRRVLRQSLEELSRIQSSISDANKQLHDERHKAIFEIGQLDQAKQSANAHMFLMSEAGKRQERHSPVATSTSAVRPMSKQMSGLGSLPSNVSSKYSNDLLYNNVKAKPPKYDTADTLSGTTTAPAILGSNYFEPFPSSRHDHSAGSTGASQRQTSLADSELSVLQKELEALRIQSSAVLTGTPL